MSAAARGLMRALSTVALASMSVSCRENSSPAAQPAGVETAHTGNAVTFEAEVELPRWTSTEILFVDLIDRSDKRALAELERQQVDRLIRSATRIKRVRSPFIEDSRPMRMTVRFELRNTVGLTLGISADDRGIKLVVNHEGEELGFQTS
ncbi:MAG: hypothetical protein HUU15_14570 [Candidatus Brocadiae bacterium]|nr:hypothetical protein [Candidatus Brocadiia bacterium]